MTENADHHPELHTDDVEALSHLIGAEAFSAAEQTIDEVFEALGLTEGSFLFDAIADRMRERLGKMPDRVAAEAVEHFQLKVPEIQRSVESEVERVVLERMKGNPDSRPVRLSGR